MTVDRGLLVEVSFFDIRDDFPVEFVDDEGDADVVAVPAGDLQRIGTPAETGGHYRDLAVSGATLAAVGGSLQHQSLLVEDA